MSDQQEWTYNRRQVLGGVGTALTATAGVSTWDGVEGMLDGEKEATDVPLGHATPDGARPNGGPMNQSYRDTPESATGVKNITKVTDQPTSYAPITNPEGITASVQYWDGQDDGYITFFDIENQEMINQIEVPSDANPGAWVDGDYLFGNATNAELRGINGEIKQTFPDNSEGAIALQGDKAYLGTGEGVAEVSKDDLTNYTQHDLIAGPNPGALTVIDQGNMIAGHAFRNLFSHNLEKEKTIAEPSVAASRAVSTDGRNLFTTTREHGLTVYRIPTETDEGFDIVDTYEIEGGVRSPIMISEKENGGKRLVAGVTNYDEFSVRGYDFENGVLNEIWSQDVQGVSDYDRGPHKNGPEQVVGVGDSVIVSSQNLRGFDMDTGEELFEEDINGKVGMPHGKYVPVGTPDGTYVLEMETGELSGQKPPQDPPEEPPSEPSQNGTDPGNGNNTDPDPPEEPPMNQTDPGSGNNTNPSNPPMNQTDPRNGNTTEPSNGTGHSNIPNDSASSDGSGPGFGLITGLAGVAGGAAYAGKRYLEQEDSDEE